MYIIYTYDYISYIPFHWNISKSGILEGGGNDNQKANDFVNRKKVLINMFFARNFQFSSLPPPSGRVKRLSRL